MDLGNFFKNIDVTTKQIIFSIILAFPVAYIDCWKLYSPFRNLDWFPQSMISVGITIIFVSFGFAISCITYTLLIYDERIESKLLGFRIIYLDLCFIAASASMFFGKFPINPIIHFAGAYLILFLVF